ncbi:MAG: outer membrane beta-barrel protein [Bacteroidetes bacterium]|nr:outer membrane beta-barrel protein [Bacteroidota bacterium]
MRQSTRNLLCFCMLFGMLALALPLHAAAHDPGKVKTSWLASDGGDVLRPERSSGAYHWYLGLDAGLTYSMFQNGPLAYYTSNPYNPKYPRPGHVNEGNGLGFYLGATADFPVSDWVGIMLKANYHTRMGVFDETLDVGEVDPQTTTGLTTVIRNQTDWTFTYLGFDLLLRFDINESAYFMIGPSFGSLSSNSATLDQELIQPSDLYYVEDINGIDDIVNFYRTASSTEEVAGFLGTRVDLKAGFGWRFELNEGLQLVPELTLAYPLSSFVDKDFTPGLESAGVFHWLSGETGLPIVENNNDFNMITVFFTLGLRWRMGS